MLTDDDEANRLVEQEFMMWADAISLAERLRTMRMSRAESGEVFAMLVANPKVDSPVKLDLRLIEADQVMTPQLLRQEADLLAIDGIIFDEHGNPIEYHVLKRHPGDNIARWTLDFDRVPASSMIHYFRSERPGQNRGIPEITPALPLFAQLRRYTLAVLAAAETAADFAAVLYTDAPAIVDLAGAESAHPLRPRCGQRRGSRVARRPRATWAPGASFPEPWTAARARSAATRSPSTTAR